MKITPYSPELEESSDFLAGRLFQNELAIPRHRENAERIEELTATLKRFRQEADEYWLALEKITKIGDFYDPRWNHGAMVQECVRIAKEALKLKPSVEEKRKA